MPPPRRFLAERGGGWSARGPMRLLRPPTGRCTFESAGDHGSRGADVSDERSAVGSPIGTRLRSETRQQHAAVEGALGFLVPGVQIAAYRAYLERWHGF